MDLTKDGFLDGRLTISQPKKGFRSGADAVLLAAAVPASKGQSVLELGLGVGVASLCLGKRVAGLRLTGLEVQPEYADLARANGRDNDIPLTVVEGNLVAMPAALKAQSFDHVMMNPPYYRLDQWTRADNEGRDRALGQRESLKDWMDAAYKRLNPGGLLTAIMKASRLNDVLTQADTRFGSIQIKPISPRIGRPAELVIIRFKKGGKGDTLLHAPLILHEGLKHQQDAAHPTVEAQAILRGVEKLSF